jgi:hypothetical protein
MTTFLGEAKVKMAKDVPVAASTLSKFINSLLTSPMIPKEIWLYVGWGTIKFESKDGWLYVGADA